MDRFTKLDILAEATTEHDRPYLQDQIAFDNWQLTLNGRQDRPIARPPIA
ncbi:hypothetical protein [Phyllobacterium sp. SB3]